MSISFASIDLILLAAGKSSRFGRAKLAERVHGRSVACYSGQTLVELPFRNHTAVISGSDFGLGELGFDLVEVVGTPALSWSIKAGIDALKKSDAGAVLIALADMPLLPKSHFASLCKNFNGDRIATSINDIVGPPAIFGRTWWNSLASLEGDRGARKLLKDSPTLSLPSAMALDIDTPDDLDKFLARLQVAQ